MRMILHVTFPTARFNELWRTGEVGAKVQQILEDTKPEAVYFGMGNDGQRGAIVVVDVASESDVPRVTEPWYLTFDATVETAVCMTREDIGKVDYESLAKKYA